MRSTDDPTAEAALSDFDDEEVGDSAAAADSVRHWGVNGDRSMVAYHAVAVDERPTEANKASNSYHFSRSESRLSKPRVLVVGLLLCAVSFGVGAWNGRRLGALLPACPPFPLSVLMAVTGCSDSADFGFFLLSSSQPPSWPVCSKTGRALWQRHFDTNNQTAASVHSLASSRASSLMWSHLTPPPASHVDPVLWRNRTPDLAVPIADMMAWANRIVAIINTVPGQQPLPTTWRYWDLMCWHTGIEAPTTFLSLVANGKYTPKQHRNVPLPHFPFPSLFDSAQGRSRLSHAPSFNFPTNWTAESFLDEGARVPSDYRLYTSDAALMRATWPGCFDNIHVDLNRSVDVRDFLAHLHTLEPLEQNSLLTARHLNTLALSLNLAKFPIGVYPPPGTPSLPIIVTTYDSPKLREKLSGFAGMMRSIIGVQDSTVLINMEDVTVDTLEMFVQQLDFARVLLYFTPVADCLVHRPYDNNVGKSWRIDLSLLWIMHVVYNLLHYQYAIVIEDDMQMSRDIYLYHLSLAQYAVDSSHIYGVAAATYSRYNECFQSAAHYSGRLQGNLSDPNDIAAPDILAHISQLDPEWPTNLTQADLVAFGAADTQQLVLDKLLIPWGAGYTHKVYAYYLNFYMQYPQSLDDVRYDRIPFYLMSIMNQRSDMYVLVPLVPRVHGDPAHYWKERTRIPLTTACQHRDWDIVFPPKYRSSIDVGAWTSRYDTVHAAQDDVSWLKEHAADSELVEPVPGGLPPP